MNDDEINRIIDDTLNSIGNLQSSVPDDVMFQKIMSGVNANGNSLSKKKFAYGSFTVAFLILVIINIFSFLNFHKNQKFEENKTTENSLNKSGIVKEFAKEYFSDSEEYNYNK